VTRSALASPLGSITPPHRPAGGMLARSEAVVSAANRAREHQQREIGKAEQLEKNASGGRGAALLDWRGHDGLTSGKHTALVDVVGVIDPKGDASADRVTESLQNAFKNKNTQGVILASISPGGSPVQAGIIYVKSAACGEFTPTFPCMRWSRTSALGRLLHRCRRRTKLRGQGEHHRVDRVIMDGWGFTGTMEKLGVERRALTSGENKAFLDPFFAGRREAEAPRAVDAGRNPQAVSSMS